MKTKDNLPNKPNRFSHSCSKCKENQSRGSGCGRFSKTKKQSLKDFTREYHNQNQGRSESLGQIHFNTLPNQGLPGNVNSVASSAFTDDSGSSSFRQKTFPNSVPSSPTPFIRRRRHNHTNSSDNLRRQRNAHNDAPLGNPLNQMQNQHRYRVLEAHPNHNFRKYLPVTISSAELMNPDQQRQGQRQGQTLGKSHGLVPVTLSDDARHKLLNIVEERVNLSKALEKLSEENSAEFLKLKRENAEGKKEILDLREQYGQLQDKLNEHVKFFRWLIQRTQMGRKTVTEAGVFSTDRGIDNVSADNFEDNGHEFEGEQEGQWHHESQSQEPRRMAKKVNLEETVHYLNETLTGKTIVTPTLATISDHSADSSDYSTSTNDLTQVAQVLAALKQDETLLQPIKKTPPKRLCPYCKELKAASYIEKHVKNVCLKKSKFVGTETLMITDGCNYNMGTQTVSERDKRAMKRGRE